MGFFLGLLKLLFGKREPWTPLFTLSDCEDDEGPQLRFDCEGDYTGECCEILDRLCAGRFAAIWMEDLFWMEQRQEKKTREIVYHTTFPMYYAQEIAGTDDLLRMHGDWKELISVSRGFDRKLFAAFLETSYVHCCDDRLYVFDETPPTCRTLREAQALRKIPCRFTAEYTPYDGALIFRERLTAVQWVSSALAFIGVMYSVVLYGNVPYLAIIIALSFALYGALKKIRLY